MKTKTKQRQMIDANNLLDIDEFTFSRIVFLDASPNEQRGLEIFSDQELSIMLNNPFLPERQRDWIWSETNNRIERLISC